MGSWTVQGVLSQRVREPADGSAPGWREWSSSSASVAGGGRKGSNAAALWVTFRNEHGGAYGGAPEVFVMGGGQRLEGVQLE